MNVPVDLEEIETRHPEQSPLTRYRGLVDDWPAFIRSMAQPLPTCLWANPLRTDGPALGRILAEEGLAPRPLAWHPGAFLINRERGFGARWWYLAGLAHCQEEASLLPVTLLDLHPGQRVLDLCAAPGGKTAQIAMALDNRGTVIANDVRLERLRALRANVNRLGLVNVTTTACNGARYPLDAGAFDRVLLDAPCNCEGTLRKHGPMPASGSAPNHSRLQLALLRRAVELCRAGGRIVYSTCTFAPEENEQVVHEVLQIFGDALTLIRPQNFPLRSAPGLTHWNGKALDPRLADSLRLWPHHNNTGGFYMAVLDKAQSAPAPAGGGSAAADLPAPELLRQLRERLGMPASVLDDFQVAHRSGQSLYLVPRDHRPTRRPRPDVLGLPVMKCKAKPPKLSTFGAMLLGRYATRNFVDLDPAQRDAYLARRTLPVPPEDVHGCTGSGYVLVRHRGHTLGTGYYDADHGVLESLFPGRWRVS